MTLFKQASYTGYGTIASTEGSEQHLQKLEHSRQVCLLCQAGLLKVVELVQAAAGDLLLRTRHRRLGKRSLRYSSKPASEPASSSRVSSNSKREKTPVTGSGRTAL